MQPTNPYFLACCPQPPRLEEAGIPGRPGGTQARRKGREDWLLILVHSKSGGKNAGYIIKIS